ncbi:MAG TPA: exodeoxyribonuclease VII small subunit [Chloroflexi bacterium]|jgi:exodeoxyribonuclease VII small subunit|nr:exodeoxyribonuclease VII small subunit [Chloroflexota bacterium]
MTEPAPAPTFEQALEELQAVVEKLQKPDVPLEDAVALYRRGTELAQQTEDLISRAELQVQKLTQSVQERFEEYSVDSTVEDGDQAPPSF